MKTLLLAALLLPLSAVTQISLFAEGRFHGALKCPSAIGWVHSNHVELWTRAEIYPRAMVGLPEFPEIRKQIGGTAVLGFGLSEVKLLAGFQNGQFVKGIHMNSETDDGRFWYNVLLIHRPPVAHDEFRLDGEFDFQGFTNPLKKNTDRRTRTSKETALGAVLRMECYEPVAHALHSGIAFRQITDKSGGNKSGTSSSDFSRTLDGKSPMRIPRDTSTSVFIFYGGPTYFINVGWGGNVAFRWTM